LTDWPADKIERRQLSELVPYARNARTHSDEQIGQIAAAIREWGWTSPILIDEEGMVIAGHGRLLAAERLGIGEVPVVVARGWSDAQKRAYLIADNKLAANAGWDTGLLQLEAADLSAMGFDFGLTGFTLSELAGLTGGPEEGTSAPPVSLADRFGVVPFSVFNAREGWWQARKRAWLDLGMQSELGRGAAPGGSRQPTINPVTGKICRADSTGAPIAGTDAGAEKAAAYKSQSALDAFQARGRTNGHG
jgi:ParB-like chromosome segregation protein Spo0J